MAHWLDPVARALAGRQDPLELFFRNDDVGWADQRLFALLDLCALHDWPIDLAVIPAAIRSQLAGALVARVEAGWPIGLHQHGFQHANYEPEGRPCEFGPSRPADAQWLDIATGRRALLADFGPCLDAIFTPPWNRCTAITERFVLKSGLTTISRDRSAGPPTVRGLADCSIGVDWFARVKGTRASREEWAVGLAREVAGATAPLGVMLHHAQMDVEEFDALDELVKTCARSGRVRGVLMRQVVPAAAAGRVEVQS
jgi:hypothetical protein